MRLRAALPLLCLVPVLAHADEPRSLRPFLSLAFTAGGDSLGSVQYTNGTSSSVKAGGETFFKGGLDYQVIPKLSLQASYGYHVDTTQDASNGSLKFKRTVVEGLAYWNYLPQQRIGLGVRKASGARLSGSGAATIPGIDFDASTGGILEWEYQTRLTPLGKGGLSLRYVHETYTPSSVDGVGPVTGQSIDGSHFGIGFSWYF